MVGNTVKDVYGLRIGKITQERTLKHRVTTLTMTVDVFEMRSEFPATDLSAAYTEVYEELVVTLHSGVIANSALTSVKRTELGVEIPVNVLSMEYRL